MITLTGRIGREGRPPTPGTPDDATRERGERNTVNKAHAWPGLEDTSQGVTPTGRVLRGEPVHFVVAFKNPGKDVSTRIVGDDSPSSSR